MGQQIERVAGDMAALSSPMGTLRLPGASGGAAPAGGGAAVAAAPEEEEESLINLDNISGRVKSSSVRKINEFIDKHPEEALNVVRQWIFKESF